MKKKLSILGSTGSVGTQCLDIVDQMPERFEVTAISCNSRAEMLLDQIKKYNPAYAVVYSESAYKEVKAMSPSSTKILCGMEGLKQIASLPDVDIAVTSLVGNIGLEPTVAALEAGKDIALANKETLVTAGELVMTLAKEKGCRILPVDSEHSAIFQALQGNSQASIEKLILTASGGPFRGKKREDLERITYKEALKHPNWSMGQKITIDSSTLMNKGLEVIEAKWLFDVDFDQIDVVVHPQSIIHSMVQYTDSSIMAQMGVPDMRLPILYALSYPERIKSVLPRLDFAAMASLTFEIPDRETFPCLNLAYEAGKVGGTLPTVLNAANEVLVYKFLKGEIGFYDIPDTISQMMGRHKVIQHPDLKTILELDQEIRNQLK